MAQKNRGQRMLPAGVAIAFAMFAGTLIAPVHAQGSKEVVSMTKEQKTLAERIVAHQKKRLESFRITHIKAETHWVKESPDQQIASPMPTKIEAWWDTSSRSYRIEIRPRIDADSGISKLTIQDLVEISNGKESLRVNHTGKYRPSVDRPFPDVLLIHETEDLVRTLSSLISGRPMKDDRGEHILRPIQWEGKDAVEYLERTLQNGKLFQEQQIILSPEENDLIRYSRSTHPSVERVFELTVHSAKQAVDGIYYASDYTTVGQSEGKKTTTHYSIHSLELLKRLPEGTLAPLTNPEEQ